MRISVCATNYNCAHALGRHLESVYRQLSGLEFEYVVVDNRSRDASLEILQTWARDHRNMTVLLKRCTRGEGRQIGFLHSRGEHIMVLDTDVIYSAILRDYVDAYFERSPDFAVQAVFCGIFPRRYWMKVGGQRSLNTNEDVDLWLRLCRLRVMKWYPIVTGQNAKESYAWGRDDFMSGRYTRIERFLRLMRRQWDQWKTRELEETDLGPIIEQNTLDLGLGIEPEHWPQDRRPQSLVEQAFEFLREMKHLMTMP